MFGKLSKNIKNSLKKIKIKELSDKDLDPIIQTIKEQLIRNEVAVDTADAIASQLKLELLQIEHTRFKSAQPLVEEALRISVTKILSEKASKDAVLINLANEAKEAKRPFIICILGINGTGKTTTIAKLTQYYLKNKFSVVLAAGDTYRAGAIEQLGNHANKLGVNMVSQQQGADPGAVAIDAIDHAEAKHVNVVIIDTAGRMQNNINLVRELEKVIRLSEPDLRIFVGDSLAGNDVIRQVKQFENDVGIDGIIMTKLDSDAKGGSVLSVAHTSSKPILFFGTGQNYDDLIPFDPEYIAKQIVPN